MTHPFKDKLCVFIGVPCRCSRQEARDRLTAVGGIFDSRITTFVSYVIAFNGADKTKQYQKALKLEQKRLLFILSEEHYFDIIEGKADAPEEPEFDENIKIIPSSNTKADIFEFECAKNEILNRKRLNNLAKYGVLTENGRTKIDLRVLDNVHRVINKLNEQ